MIERADIELAAERIRGHVRETPVVQIEAPWDASATAALKLEFLQHTGSFKARGAFHRILSSTVPPSGIMAASGGNHGAAAAFAARALGHAAEIFVPEISSPVKIARLRSYGATVTVTGATYAEALEASSVRARETGALVVHAYDQPEVLAGQGTLAREFASQVDALDTVFVAVGGGGLIGGVAAWFRGGARVIGVEPVLAPTLARAFEAGAPVDVPIGGYAADSLGARRVGDQVWPIARAWIERVILVTDEDIQDAQRWLWQHLRIVAEPGGATAWAALHSGRYVPQKGERVGVILCGANTDLASFPA